MKTAPQTSVPAVTRPLGRAPAYVELAKLRLSGLVVVTAGAGYLIAAGGSANLPALLALVTGTLFLAGGASAMNQVMEVEPDARMLRTRDRPLPGGRLSPVAALGFTLASSLFGVAILATASGWLTAGLGVATWVIYVLAYTPLKRRSSLCTPVGALVGALPPVMGWTAATGRVEAGALALGAVLFMWQIPHFLAIAWLYREDYARGGFRMLPLEDEDGRRTFTMVILYCAALVPVSLVAGVTCGSGWLYPVGALLLGAVFLAAGVQLERSRTRTAARHLFFTSLLYLPLLLVLLALDPTGSGGVR